jgi:hypothetical protein
MGRRGLDGPKLDSILHQFFLEAVGEELPAAVLWIGNGNSSITNSETAKSLLLSDG